MGDERTPDDRAEMIEEAFVAIDGLFPYEDKDGKRYNVLHASDWKDIRLPMRPDGSYIWGVWGDAH